MRSAPLVICYRYERDAVKALFPEPCRVLAEGESTMGFRASVILVTKHINTSSDWFRECAMTRLAPGAKVIRIGSA